MVDVSESVAARTVPAQRRPDAAPRRRPLAWVLVPFAVAGLFVAYLRLARTVPVNGDGAGNALQAWDMLHGNVLLRGWTVSDVPFYSTELIQHALVELVIGYNADVVHVAAAMTYTMLVVLTAVLARGRATGVAGIVRMGAAAAFLLVPGPGAGRLIVLSAPNHTGTGVPLLVTWIVLDRALTRADGGSRDGASRWLPYLIGALLVWGQVGDPLVTFVGALPLVAVCAIRLWRRGGRWPHRWRGLEARLLLAGVLSTVVAQAILHAIRFAGGFYTIPAELKFAWIGDLGSRLWKTGTAIAVIFGGYLPETEDPAEFALGLLHLVGVAAVFVAVALVVGRTLRNAPDGDLVNQALATGILLNLAAYWVSTLPVDLGGGREIIAVLPFGAALAVRVFAPRWQPSPILPALAAVLVVLMVALAIEPLPRAAGAENQDVADWLMARKQTYGVGSYWTANNVTLATGGRVQVVPLTGDAPLMAYRRESRADWYDATRNDARFVVIDTRPPHTGMLESAISRFGPPVSQHQFDGAVVLLYNHNLLIGLPAYCGDKIAPSLAEC
jgi:hypothetical protein